MTSASPYPQGTTVYGRVTIVDQLGNVLTDYYPCANGNNRLENRGGLQSTDHAALGRAPAADKKTGGLSITTDHPCAHPRASAPAYA